MSPVRRPRRPPKEAPPAPEGPPVPETLPLGRTGRTHPALGVGLWAMGRWKAEDERATRSVIEHALAIGVPWFDTAEVYGGGRSERLLGDALVHHPPARPVFLTTKVSSEHLRPSQVRAALTQSLGRLARRSVDVYLVHAPEPSLPIGPTMEALEALWKEGRIGAVGVSNFSVEEMVAARDALRDAPLVVNQVRYSLLARDEGDRVRDYCAKNGIVLEAYTPLARGLLAGRYLDGQEPPADVRRFSRDLFDQDRFPEVRAAAKAVREIANEAGVPMIALALHWLRRRGAAPVFGARNPAQVDEVLRAWAARPSDALLDRAEAAARVRS